MKGKSRAKATPKRPSPRAKAKTASLIPSYFSAPKKLVQPSSDDFDGIEEISEADITAEELQRSEQRKAARARNRLSSSARPSSAAPTLNSDGVEAEHIDLSASSPVRRSPRKPASPLKSTSPIKSSPLKASSVPHASSSARTPSPPVRNRRRRIAAVSSDEDDDVPLSINRRPVPASKAKAVPVPESSATHSAEPRSSPVPNEEGEGKARADPDEEDETAFLAEYIDDDTPVSLDAVSDEERNEDPDQGEVSIDYEDGWDPTMADLPMDDYSPIDDIPDFSILPSTQPPRDRTPTPIYISDDDTDESPIALKRTPGGLTGAAARAAALRASLGGSAVTPGAGDVLDSPSAAKFDDLTLLDELDDHIRAFYEEHWRRGADQSSDEDDDPDNDFGVAAVVQNRAPAKRGRGRGRGRARGGWVGRGRGRGSWKRK